MEAAKVAAKAKADEVVDKAKAAAGIGPREWNEVRMRRGRRVSRAPVSGFCL
jgi:hypothetical protein